MDRILIVLFDGLERFERWFDLRFGWFFTNGMKHRSTPKQRSLRA